MAMVTVMDTDMAMVMEEGNLNFPLFCKKRKKIFGHTEIYSIMI